MIDGSVEPGFEPLYQRFAELFSDFAEEGAALSVYQHGEALVQLWAGHRDRAKQQAWQQDTRVNVFSASKAIVALCVLQLLERGLLELDRPIATDWPEFAALNKHTVTLRQVLAHRSGVNAFGPRMAQDSIYDWAQVRSAIENSESCWQPGSQQGYSPMLYGWILGELICRVSGEPSFNHYFQKHVAGPLGLKAAFGVAPSEHASLAELGPLKKANKGRLSEANSAQLGQLMKAEPQGVTARAFTNPMTLLTGSNTPQWRAAQVPAANGHFSAEDLARIYGALACEGSLEGDQLLGSDMLAYCYEEQSRGEDAVLGTFLRFSLGFMLPQEGRADCCLGAGPRSFGHPGAGGCVGFADIDHGIGFAFVSARMGQSLLVDPRAQYLIDGLKEEGLL